MYLKINATLILIILFSITDIISAQQYPANDISLAIVHAAFDVLQQQKPSVENRIELRKDIDDSGFGQFIGIMFNAHGANHFYTGIYYNLNLDDFLVITPSFAPGIYLENESKKLFYPVEFRSQIELSFKVFTGVRLGFSFNHISNAGLGKENPGVESLAVTYIISL
ncbi:MAG: acyloxyacyl hydrolase [Ignavibacteriaceae bacterium]